MPTSHLAKKGSRPDMVRGVSSAYVGRLTGRVSAPSGGTMTALWLLLVLAVGAYLLYALLYPERF